MIAPPPPAPRSPSRLVPIADIARRLGITSRALRHYQDKGLIRSQRLARNVRAYDADTVAVVEMIVALRQADLPLSVIRQILSRREDPTAQAQMMRSALAAAILEKQDQIETMRSLMASLDAPGRAKDR